MTRRRRRLNPWLVTFLIVAIAAVVYINMVIVPTIPPLFIPTQTPTTNPQTYTNNADQLAAGGKFVQAIAAYQQAISANPKEPANYIAVARVQLIVGQYLEAQKNIEKAILLNRNSALAQAILGRSLAMQDDYLAAESAYNTALGIDPNNALAHAYYAELLVDLVNQGKGQLGSLDKAAEESRKAVALDSSLYETHQARGLVLESTSNYEDAVAEYQAALAINDNIASLHLALGRIYYVNMNNYVQAVEEFTKAYALNPGDPLPNLYISRVYVKTGDFAKAAQYAEQALKDDPADATLQGNLGSMYYKLGEYDLAIQYLRLAIQGGITEDGLVVEGIPLAKDNRTLEYFSRYGLALARTNACSEAIQVAQAMLQGVGDDETAAYNANEMIRICKENLSGTPTPTAEIIPTVNATSTP
jgi:tetratricopeptide (TPR) repeat protein